MPLFERRDLIRSKKRVVLSGMGASFFGCIGFQYALAALGIHAVALETGELLYFLKPLIDRDTAVVLVSRSGESIEVTKLLDDLRALGAAVIGIVNVAESALARAADVTILMGSAADQMVAVQTYTGTLATLGLLDGAMASELEPAKTELEQLASILSKVDSRVCFCEPRMAQFSRERESTVSSGAWASPGYGCRRRTADARDGQSGGGRNVSPSVPTRAGGSGEPRLSRHHYRDAG